MPLHFIISLFPLLLAHDSTTPHRPHWPLPSPDSFTGTWRVLDDPAAANVDNLLERLHACLDLGITTLDTAEIYGLYRVEEFLGEAFKKEPGLRDKFEIVTKSGIYVPCDFHPDRKVAFYNATAARIVKSAEKSLRLLGTDRLDLLFGASP